MSHTFKVYREHNGDWLQIPFAEGTLAYCNGYVDALDSLYPSPRYKIMKCGTITRDFSIVRETNGRSSVHTN